MPATLKTATPKFPELTRAGMGDCCEMGTSKFATKTDRSGIQSEIAQFKAEFRLALLVQVVGIIAFTVALIKLLP